MTLHLVRWALDPRALAAFAVGNGASDDDGGYAVHLALRRRFGPAGPQPFRIVEARDGATALLAYTTDADALADAATLPATDPLLDRLLPGVPEMRAMPAAWREGARYGFEVRARPVVRFGGRLKTERGQSEQAAAPENWWARAGEVDAWIAARTRPDGDPGISREAACLAWLTDRLAPVAELHDVAMRQGRRVRTRRSPHERPGRRRVEGPEAIMAGTLTIRDPAAFAAMLARGVGRHTAFGFGMLLLSPPGRAG